VNPAAVGISEFLDDDALAMVEGKPSLAPQNAILMAMREEIVALTVACIYIAFFPTAANAAEVLVPEDVFASSATLLILLAGVVVSFYAGAVALSITASVDAVNAMVTPTLHGTGRAATVSVPREYKDWLAGRPLPTIDELSDACVLIASGPNGHWAVCTTANDEACEPDEIFTAYYGQPVFVCPV